MPPKEYVSISLPRGLWGEIARILRVTSYKTRTEFVKAAVHEKIEKELRSVALTTELLGKLSRRRAR